MIITFRLNFNIISVRPSVWLTIVPYLLLLAIVSRGGGMVPCRPGNDGQLNQCILFALFDWNIILIHLTFLLIC